MKNNALEIYFSDTYINIYILVIHFLVQLWLFLWLIIYSETKQKFNRTIYLKFKPLQPSPMKTTQRKYIL